MNPAQLFSCPMRVLVLNNNCSVGIRDVDLDPVRYVSLCYHPLLQVLWMSLSFLHLPVWRQSPKAVLQHCEDVEGT